MQTQSGGLRRIRAFATGAGVSVRTLHLYDRLGLLRPAAVSESGYRSYGDAELEGLEHILALRFVGFSLDQINGLLAGSDLPLAAALHMQREVIARQKRRLESVLTVIEEAQRVLAERRIGRPLDDSSYRHGGIHNAKRLKWTQEYYSESAREKTTSSGVARRLRSSSKANGTGRHLSPRSKPRLQTASNRRARRLEHSRGAGASWSRSLRRVTLKFHGG